MTHIHRLTEKQLRRRTLACVVLLGMSLLFRILESEPSASFVSIDVSGMCCQYVASHVSEDLARINGVLSVEPHIPDKQLLIGVSAARPPSPRALWEAVERSEAHPMRLVMNESAYREKPGF